MRARLLTAFLLCISLSLTSLRAMEYRNPTDDDQSDDDEVHEMSQESDGFEYEEDYSWLPRVLKETNEKKLRHLFLLELEKPSKKRELDEIKKALSSEESEVTDESRRSDDARDYSAPIEAADDETDEEFARRMLEQEQAVRAPDHAYSEQLIGGGQTRWKWNLPWALHGCVHPKSKVEIDQDTILANWDFQVENRKELKAACIERLEGERAELEPKLQKMEEEIKQLKEDTDRYERSNREAEDTDRNERSNGEAEAKQVEDRRTNEPTPTQGDCQETKSGKRERESSEVPAPEMIDSGHGQEKKADELEKSEAEKDKMSEAELRQKRLAFFTRKTE